MRTKSLVICTSQRWLFDSTMMNRSIDLQQKIMQNRNCLEFINKSPDYELYGFRYPIKMLGNQNQFPIFPKHYLPITFVSIGDCVSRSRNTPSSSLGTLALVTISSTQRSSQNLLTGKPWWKREHPERRSGWPPCYSVQPPWLLLVGIKRWRLVKLLP